ncbi:hypothetical protein F0L74_01340 [Chitinophaga agrisoli]|uniref:Uncharacterized protein n=1 Tax=Chitinophaga agrisoli TaxID=2607653 RepID=A0A5B2W2D2_9BACT|nr:hypothetical protein [Chitinophaga agrisoli]KAA2244647.1 hypothetical protein F0L74_01340 [Chitinophaga agrisoli]
MNEQQHLETLSDIKRIMERSSRFISLSGLSGVWAGLTGLAGAAVAFTQMSDYYIAWDTRGSYSDADYAALRYNLITLGAIVLAVAVAGGYYFTRRRARRNNVPIWDATSRKVLVNFGIPLVAGGCFILGLMFNNFVTLIAPSCLVFYGLALVNASKYTLSDIRYLGLAEIALGILNIFFLRRGLYFWTLGFGVLHIVYGLVMWWKYERPAKEQ